MPGKSVLSRMGCSPSGPAAAQQSDIAGVELKLQHSKLKFGVGQLKALNAKLTQLSDDLKTPFLSDDAESMAERLVQGLVCGAAAKDARFKSKFIVVLHRDRLCKSSSLEYLVLLDELDGNCAFAEGPPGCARLRPLDHVAHEWQEFLTPSGYLRRDKIIERWVEVLASAAADGVLGCSTTMPSSEVSTAPGHLVGAAALQKLRNAKPQEQCFYGNVKEGGQFPSSRDYRVAIVEGNPWVRVRLAGGVLGAGTEAKLALGIAFNGWPTSSDFPQRIPLGHADAFACYRAAQTGFFVVGGGPGAGVQWSERSAGWQVWTSGARSTLHARGEAFARVGRVCAAVLEHLRATGQPPLRAVSRFMLEEALLWRAEKVVGRGPGGILRSWSGAHLAHQVLCVFDIILGEIRARSGRHYFFEDCDMIKMAVWRGSRIGERDWRGDAESLMGFLRKLHEEGYQKEIEEVEILPSSQERLESALCCRWGLLLQELTPPGSTKGRRLAGAPTYSPRQIAYVAAASRELLAARQCVIQESNEWYQGSFTTVNSQYQDPIEDLIHLLAIILDQARDYFLKIHYNNDAVIKSFADTKPLSSYQPNASKDTLRRQKLKSCFDAAATYLLDSVRRDTETVKEDLSDDSVLVKILLKWLYKSIDEDKKYLSVVLKPYLEMLFTTSHENCWHLEQMRMRTSDKELSELMIFSQMVGEGSISPADGILDAASKGWQWAESILDTLDSVAKLGCALRMIFTSPDGRILKFDLSLPNDIDERENWELFHAKRFEGYTAKLKLAEKCVVEAFSCGLERGESILESTAISNRGDELSQKYDFNFNSGSNTNTLKSFKSMSGTILSEFDNANKYHTLRSLDSKYSTLRQSENLFGSSWSNGSTIKLKEKFKTPVVHGKLNSKETESDADIVDDIDLSLHCNLRDLSPMNVAHSTSVQISPHREYAGIIKALICLQKYSILQELAGWLPNATEKTGALKALHRLARAGRRSSGSLVSPSKPIAEKHNYTLSPKKAQSRQRASIRQYYRRRNIDALSGDESSKKSEKKLEQALTPRTQELLDVEVHKEYMENKTLHSEIEQMAERNERYMELCREAIRDSQGKLKKSSFSRFDKEIKSRIMKKDSFRSSSVGRNIGMDLSSEDRFGNQTSSHTVGRNFGKELQNSSNSLLGTCRKSRLHQAARKSVLPRTTSSVANGLIGDSFKISPLYSGAQSEYDLMTQSILQYPNQSVAADRQRQLTMSRDRLYP